MAGRDDNDIHICPASAKSSVSLGSWIADVTYAGGAH